MYGVIVNANNFCTKALSVSLKKTVGFVKRLQIHVISFWGTKFGQRNLGQIGSVAPRGI